MIDNQKDNTGLLDGENARVCTCCKVLKPFSAFSKMKAGKYGLTASCKECNNFKTRAKYAANPEKKLVKNRQYLLDHKESFSEYRKQWAIENADKIKEKSKKYYEENADAIRLKLDKWKKENFARYKEAAKEYYQANKEEINKRAVLNRKKNSHIYNEKTRRYAAKRRAGTSNKLTSKDLQDMQDFYALAKAMSEVTGEKWQVDHIVPITHELVCGLHVPWNLQILTASENIIKSNNFTVG